MQGPSSVSGVASATRELSFEQAQVLSQVIG